jgi:hypothetical protein
MDPITLSAIIGGATSAIQGIAGLFQKNKAKKLEEQYPRPTATMADSIKKLASYAYGQTFDQDIPGGELYRGEIKGATSAGIRAASELGSGSEAYGMLGRLVGGEQNALSDLAKLTAQRVAGAEQNYMNVLSGPVYEEERRVDYWNREMPYLQAAQTAQQLRQAGGMNIMSGLKNIGGVVSEAVAPDLYSSLFGKGQANGSGFSRAALDKYLEEWNANQSGGSLFRNNTSSGTAKWIM